MRLVPRGPPGQEPVPVDSQMELMRATIVKCYAVEVADFVHPAPKSGSTGLRLLSVAAIMLATAGCQPKAATSTAKTPPPPEVVITGPVEREYAPYEEFTGRLEASEVIEIRARVGGYLDKVLFHDGADVEEN